MDDKGEATTPIRYLHPPEIVRQSEREYAGERRVSKWIVPWDFKEALDVGIIGAPLASAGSFWKGVGEAPNAIRERFAVSFGTFGSDFEIDMRALRVRDIGDIEMETADVVGSQQRISLALSQLYQYRSDFIPVLIGGEHAITWPSVRAFREGRGERLGLIHFDAHHDLRSFEKGPTSGTPFRGILEEGLVDGRNLVQVGLHGFTSSKEEFEYGKSKGVRYFSVREIRRRGILEVMEEAALAAAEATEAIYVSLDIDVLDPAFCPGTGSPEIGGLTPWDLLEAVCFLGRHPKVKALDLVEIDPAKDVKDLSVRMGCSVILTFLTGTCLRMFQEGGGP